MRTIKGTGITTAVSDTGRWLSVILAGLVGLFALGLSGRVDADIRIDSDYTIEVGYRGDKLSWNIADVDGSPNVLSELSWTDLRIIEGRVRGGIALGAGSHYLRLQGFWGSGGIIDGKNQDSDYLGDNRTQEFSRSNNQADSGSVLDWSVGGGYEFRTRSDRLRLRLLGGYGWNEQKLRMTDGVQTVTSPGLPPLGPIAGLRNRYETEWKGPWTGLDLLLRFGDRLRVFGTFEHHWADYYAEAEWNLRTEPVTGFQQPKSFEHIAEGTGIVFGGGMEYDFSKSWGLRCSGSWQDWQTDPGIDRVFPINGGFIESPLNEVNWTSWSVSVGVTLRLSALSRGFRSD